MKICFGVFLRLTKIVKPNRFQRNHIIVDTTKHILMHQMAHSMKLRGFNCGKQQQRRRNASLLLLPLTHVRHSLPLCVGTHALHTKKIMLAEFLAVIYSNAVKKYDYAQRQL